MNKTELVSKIAAEAELTKDEAKKALDATTNIITQALKDKDDVVLVGFGTFTTQERAARQGRNPKTGEPLNIAASTSPKFKVVWNERKSTPIIWPSCKISILKRFVVFIYNIIIGFNDL